MMTGSVRVTLSRSGPTVPAVFASLSLWQSPHVLTKSGFPAFGLPTSFGGTVVPRCASAIAGTAAVMTAAATSARRFAPITMALSIPRHHPGAE